MHNWPLQLDGRVVQPGECEISGRIPYGKDEGDQRPTEEIEDELQDDQAPEAAPADAEVPDADEDQRDDDARPPKVDIYA